MRTVGPPLFNDGAIAYPLAMVKPVPTLPRPTKAIRPKRAALARREDPNVRRQDLLAVTLRCLAELGPSRTTGREICRRAGVSHSLLGHYFDNPSNLLLETYQSFCDRSVAHFEEELFGQVRAPWDLLEAYFKLHFSDDWSGGDIFGAWIGFWTLVRLDPAFAVVRDGFNQRIHTFLLRVLRRFSREDCTLPPKDVAAILSATIDGLWVDFGMSPARMTREKALSYCMMTAHRLIN